jgi:hypothetical protein
MVGKWLPPRTKHGLFMLAMLGTASAYSDGWTAGEGVPESVAVSGSPTSITLERVATLGRFEDSISVTHVGEVVWVEDRGEYLVTNPSGNRFLRYDRQGNHVGILGRPGDGPGEFRYIGPVAIGPDGSIYVFEVGGRLTVLSPEYEVLRTVRLPILRILEAAILPGSEEIVAAGMIYSRELVGFPLQKISPAGEHLLSFGGLNPEVRSDRPSQDLRRLTVDPEGHVWAVRPDRYVLERFGPDGQPTGRIQRDAEWFPPRPYDLAEPPSLPSPIVRAIRSMSTGNRLITLTVVAAEPFDPLLPWGHETPTSPEQRNRLRDSVIEVLDATNGTVLASTRIEPAGYGFAAPDRLYTAREDAVGTILIDIWRITITDGEAQS